MMEFILGLILPTIAAYVAQKRGRSGLAWFLITLLGPAIAALLLFVAGNGDASVWCLFFGTPIAVLVLYALPRLQDRTKKTCPMCSEIVQAKALVCRYCHHEFADSRPVNQPAIPAPLFARTAGRPDPFARDTPKERSNP